MLGGTINQQRFQNPQDSINQMVQIDIDVNSKNGSLHHKQLLIKQDNL
jgi:hypothetical protein